MAGPAGRIGHHVDWVLLAKEFWKSSSFVIPLEADCPSYCHVISLKRGRRKEERGKRKMAKNPQNSMV
jgi:hypothetical protein